MSLVSVAGFDVEKRQAPCEACEVSVVLRQHDREDPARFQRVARVF